MAMVGSLLFSLNNWHDAVAPEQKGGAFVNLSLLLVFNAL